MEQTEGGAAVVEAEAIPAAAPDPSPLPVPDGGAAEVVIAAFMSVGVEQIDRLYTGGGKAVDYRRDVAASDLRRWIAKNLCWAAKQHLSVIVRPRRPAGLALVQLDDLSPETMDRLRPVAFLAVETSPGNCQAWVAVPAAEADAKFVHRLKRGTGADMGASGAVRIAGSINFKEKYAPNFPRVRLVHTALGLITTRAQLEALGVVATPEATPVVSSAGPEIIPAATPLAPPKSHEEELAATVVTVGPARRKPRAWPDYQRCLDGAPLNREGTGPDRSKADFTWCMIAIDWGSTVEETAGHLMELSDKAQERHDDYATVTAQRAAQAVERNRRRSEACCR